MSDEILSVDEGSSVDLPSGNESINGPMDSRSFHTGSSVDSSGYGSVGGSESVSSSPILFKLLDETDGPETVDSPQQKCGVFGASLSTRSKDGGHFLHQLHKDDRDQWSKIRDGDKVHDGDELQYINQMNMTRWSHQEVLETIRHLKNDITFTFFREKKEFEEDHIERTEDLFIEITFNISDLDSDGKGISIGNVASHIKGVMIKVVQNISYKSSLNVVSFSGSTEVKIGHGAMTQRYLRAKQDEVDMERRTSDQKPYCFQMHSYVVQDREDADPRSLERMVAFQSCLNNKFLMCQKSSKKLTLLEIHIDDNQLQVKAANSPCLFLMTENGSEDFYLESVAYEGHFLGFDEVDRLELTHLKNSPASPKFQETDVIRRNYTFHIH
ncbi:uncharacterized protein LOC124110900 [Haliotis rufescens]|uniref:uncharacterized protein LOC124110900 n=1 Tax=Haliotis rufescens TaxID=6454 RepID=UPI00201F8AE6|nr:uncharacterized protein LOC124110900 [Haliotis rufescens]